MHITYDIAPTPGHPRNSEGAVLPLADGRMLFIYSAFSGESARDHTPADLAAITSCDGGRTWSAPRTVVRAAEYGAMNVIFSHSFSISPVVSKGILNTPWEFLIR